MTYDDASRLTQLSHVKAAAIIAQLDYGMDVVNRRTNRVEQLSTGGPTTRTCPFHATQFHSINHHRIP
jgi:hypothetical protein